MRSAQRIVATLAALFAAGGNAEAQSGAFPDVRSIKPVVMLLVDTSGSMERVPEASEGGGFPQCGGTPTNSERNRWTITLEALTGTFKDFSCKPESRHQYPVTAYDYGYHLPHFRIESAEQLTDGLLDEYRHRLKFGLMTFDGANTTVGGDTLVPLSRWVKGDPFRAQAYDAPGMYSYGRIGRLSFPGCDEIDYGVNAGARGPGDHPGALIAPGLLDDATSLETVNQAIQDSLREVRPFGGTPIAAMLDDLQYFLLNDQSVKKDIDTFYECRPRYAILLTDGVPDSMFRDGRFNCDYPGRGPEGNECAPVTTDIEEHRAGSDPLCECPYPLENDLARELRTNNGLTKLFVVALNVAGDAAAIETLNEIAQSGGEQDAYFVENRGDLEKVLDEIASAAQSGATSRSVPQVVDNGKAMHLGGKQYEITAGFLMGATESHLRQGYLNRQRFGCSEAQVPVALPLEESQGDMFHLELNKQAATGRTIITVALDDSTASKRDSTLRSHYYEVSESYAQPVYNRRLPNGQEIAGSAPTYAAATEVAPELVNFSVDNLPLEPFGTTQTRENVVKYVRGTTPERKDKVLADIYHSNPVVLPPLSSGSRHLDSEEEALNAEMLDFVTPNGKYDHYGEDGRPGVVFVGTNDGVLHAFNLDTWKDRNDKEWAAGHEFWGFVPASLFGKLPAASAPKYTELFDGTPLVKNMMLGRDSSNAPQFRTVLVSALRSVPSFVALDVTYPEQAPTFLWQFNATSLGRTVGTPALTQALIKWGGGGGDNDGVLERAIAILPGGAGKLVSPQPSTGCAVEANVTQAAYPLNDARARVRCWEKTGRALYVVDVATGELLQEFDHNHFPSPLTGAVAVDAQGLDVSKAAYFTDEDGVLWRLSMIDPNPNNWEVKPIFDVFYPDELTESFKNGRPSIYPPVLSRDQYGNNVIIVGTGDVDNLVDTAKHRLVSLLERRTFSNSGVEQVAYEVNWEWTFEAGESVTGPLSLFDSVLYFGTFLSPQGTDACEMGYSRIWGVHYMQPETVASEPEDSENEASPDAGPRAPRPMLPKDGVVGATSYERYLESEDLKNSLVLGVAISSQPLCVEVQKISDPFMPIGDGYQPTGRMGGGNYQLRAMVGGEGGTLLPNSQLRQFNMQLGVTNQSRMVGWGGLVE